MAIESGFVYRSKLTVWVLMLATLCALAAGCRITTEEGARRAAWVASLGTPQAIHVKPVKHNPELGFLKQLVTHAPQPSERTQQLLRRNNLADRYDSEPEYVIRWLKEICCDSHNLEEVHALAEIALIQANWAAQKRDAETATELYATAIVHAYQFLFDGKLDVGRNAYDPQFRSICDVYNQSLEGLLRIACGSDKLQPGMRHMIGKGDMKFEFTVEIKGRWKDESFERFELTNDYEMKGIENLYLTYGLGVPLIAVHKAGKTKNPTAKYYPPSLTLPLTAFCEVLPPEDSDDSRPQVRRAILKLYDPLEQTSITLAGRTVPLESDITTPLAYHMNDPLLNTSVLATASMLNANIAKELYGLHLLEPFDPNKIPVVMVHGLWSSPMTWIEMFNDLRANRDLTTNYQFWFYAYPTGQPIWDSAREMRRDLAEARSVLDPDNSSTSFDRMVLVGHSMGGLISRLQVTTSEDHFWNIVSDEDFDRLNGDPDLLSQLRETFFFRPNPAVKRVITLATPFHGSKLSNPATRWASEKFFTLPDQETRDLNQLARDNEQIIKNARILTSTTSIDSLAPDSPFVAAMQQAAKSEDVKYHNIIGNIPRKSLWIKPGTVKKAGDGVVSVDSAKAKDVESEIEVEAEHAKLHQHPKTILEVRRILLVHLVEYNRIKDPRLPVIPAGFDANVEPSGDGQSVELIQLSRRH